MKYLIILSTLALASCGSSEGEVLGSKPESSGALDQSAVVQGETLGDDFNFSAFGSIDGKYDFTMYLHALGGKVSGVYFYNKHGVHINLSGSYNSENGEVILTEFNEGEKTGEFKLNLFKSELAEGEWKAFSKAPGRTEAMAVEMKLQFEDFKWYAMHGPFHPIHVEALINYEGTVNPQDLNVAPQEIEGAVFEENNPLFYYINDPEALRNPFFEYEVIAEYGNEFFLRTTSSGGGTGIFSSIMHVRVDDSEVLHYVGSISGGDRCNGGLSNAKADGRDLSFSQNITAQDVFYLGAEGEGYEMANLDGSAAGCYGKVNMKYVVASGESEVVSYSFNSEEYEVGYEGQGYDEYLFHEVINAVIAEFGMTIEPEVAASIYSRFVEYRAEDELIEGC